MTYQLNPLLEVTSGELALIPALTTGIGSVIGAGSSNIYSRIKHKDLPEEERKQKIKDSTIRGTLIGGGVGLAGGLTASAIILKRALNYSKQLKKTREAERIAAEKAAELERKAKAVRDAEIAAHIKKEQEYWDRQTARLNEIQKSIEQDLKSIGKVIDQMSPEKKEEILKILQYL